MLSLFASILMILCSPGIETAAAAAYPKKNNHDFGCTITEIRPPRERRKKHKKKKKKKDRKDVLSDGSLKVIVEQK